jgi:hypothetical protein
MKVTTTNQAAAWTDEVKKPARLFNKEWEASTSFCKTPTVRYGINLIKYRSGEEPYRILTLRSYKLEAFLHDVEHEDRTVILDTLGFTSEDSARSFLTMRMKQIAEENELEDMVTISYPVPAVKGKKIIYNFVYFYFESDLTTWKEKNAGLDFQQYPQYII